VFTALLPVMVVSTTMNGGRISLKPEVKTIASQPSWVIRTADVELAVTQLGGHMAPVTFYRRSAGPFQPYYISPWQGDGLTIDEPVLVPLRGDFFCAPFGNNVDAYRGEKHCLHGEPPTAKWTFVDLDKDGATTSLVMSMKTNVRQGKITKRLTLVDGQNVVYSRNTLEGYSGAMPLGHHATLALPEQEGSVRVSTSPFRLGMTYPVPSGDPTVGEYQSLAINKPFKNLTRVPLIWKGEGSCDASEYPARKGFADLLAVFNKSGKTPAWTTATFTKQGYLWFSLKDANVLNSTLFWISNHGRHSFPWNGRNRCLGLEDVCGYFALGLADSVRPNPLTKAGIRTAIELSPKRPFSVNYIQGVVKTPRGFGRVKSAKFTPGKVTFVSPNGKTATAEVCHEFLADGRLLDCGA